MKTFTYRATLEPGEQDGVVVVTFPDVPEAVTEGDSKEEALVNAAEALGLALLSYPVRNKAIPAATAKGGVPVNVDPEVAVKLLVLEAFAEAGISKSELARRMGRHETEARRILDPMHPTKLPSLVEAARALGKRIVIGVEDIPHAA